MGEVKNFTDKEDKKQAQIDKVVKDIMVSIRDPFEDIATTFIDAEENQKVAATIELKRDKKSGECQIIIKLTGSKNYGQITREINVAGSQISIGSVIY